MITIIILLTASTLWYFMQCRWHKFLSEYFKSELICANNEIVDLEELTDSENRTNLGDLISDHGNLYKSFDLWAYQVYKDLDDEIKEKHDILCFSDMLSLSIDILEQIKTCEDEREGMEFYYE